VPEPTNHLDSFVMSLERCLQSSGFITAFYGRFLESSDEVKEKFARTDFGAQEKRLERSLRTMAGVMVGDLEALRHLNARAVSHDRYHLDIRPDLYELWRWALLTTAQEFDREWSPFTEESWRVILENAIAYMTKRY